MKQGPFERGERFRDSTQTQASVLVQVGSRMVVAAGGVLGWHSRGAAGSGYHSVLGIVVGALVRFVAQIRV